MLYGSGNMSPIGSAWPYDQQRMAVVGDAFVSVFQSTDVFINPHCGLCTRWQASDGFVLFLQRVLRADELTPNLFARSAIAAFVEDKRQSTNDSSSS
jgi:hypothetical protein